MFLNRGDLNIGINGGEEAKHIVRRYFFYRNTKIPLDNTYVIFQMIVTFIILIIGIGAVLFNHQSIIIDPIKNIKNNFILINLLALVIIFIGIIIINKFSKNERLLINRLVLSLLMTVIIMFSSIITKYNLDKIYNVDKFEDLYIQQEKEEKDNKVEKKEKYNNKKINIGIDGLAIKDDKQIYVDESMTLYKIFTVKHFMLLFINILIVIMIIYQIFSITQKIYKKENMNKDDQILFDEEKSIK